jgi:hypothetical protein
MQSGTQLPTNSSKKWTTEEDELLLKLVAANKLRFAIAAALRRTSKGVDRRLNVLRRDGRAREGSQTSAAAIGTAAP